MSFIIDHWDCQEIFLPGSVVIGSCTNPPGLLRKTLRTLIRFEAKCQMQIEMNFQEKWGIEPESAMDFLSIL